VAVQLPSPRAAQVRSVPTCSRPGSRQYEFRDRLASGGLAG
jgi:hypothetical protein